MSDKDWTMLTLGEDNSQTAPVCNGTVREMIAEITRLKGENAALSAVICPMDMAVGDESGNVVCNLENDYWGEQAEKWNGKIDTLKARVQELETHINNDCAPLDFYKEIKADRDRYRNALERVRDEARIVFDAKTIAQEALEVKDER